MNVLKDVVERTLCCFVTSKELFIRLKRERVLDVDNDIDLFCLNEIFTCHISMFV